MSVDYRIGDVRERLAEIPDGSIDLVLTSPPFLALRSYLPADHPDKGREIGSEATPAEFLTTLLALTEEWARVLAPHGSIAVELGDTYSGSGGAGGDYGASGLRETQPKFVGSNARARYKGDERSSRGTRGRLDGHASGPGGHHLGGPAWPPPKSLCMIPQLYAASLAYGQNMLTGEPTDPWRVRNWITWGRPNPPVGALGDKVRPASSFFTVACKSAKRWFDLDAVRTPPTAAEGRIKESNVTREQSRPNVVGDEESVRFARRIDAHPAGAPPLDWWTDDYDELETALLIQSTEPYKGAHYATWPSAIARRFVLMMCPPKVCMECGEPSRRIVEHESAGLNTRKSRGLADVPAQRGAVVSTLVPDCATVTTLGWSDCGHDAYHSGTVLDPFAGSGTTLVVAHCAGRDAIGIDLDDRNRALFEERLAAVDGGLFDFSAAVADVVDPDGVRQPELAAADDR